MKPNSDIAIPQYRQDLQGLRAIAILLVVFAHARLSILPGGFIGVDVFFVLSGYLITGILLKELQQHKRISFLRFYSRRLKRLLPALVLMLAVTTLVAHFVLSEVEIRSQLASLPFASTWSSNLYFTFKTVDYFNELAQRDLFLHTWSLGVEEQFYLLWPVLLLLFFKLGKSQHLKSSNYLITGLSLAFIASLITSFIWTRNIPDAAFYTMPSRVWQLALGALVHFVPDMSVSDALRLPSVVRNYLKQYIKIIGLFLIIGSAICLHPNLAYPGYWALFPSLGAVLIIVAGHSSGKIKKDYLSYPAMVWVGDRSYSLYLWHWPIFTIGFSIGFEGHLLQTFCLFLLSLLASIISYRCVEYPFWKGKLTGYRF